MHALYTSGIRVIISLLESTELGDGGGADRHDAGAPPLLPAARNAHFAHRDGAVRPYEEAWLALGRVGGGTSGSADGGPTEVVHFPIPDFGVPTADRLREILAAIDGCLARGRPLYLHCWGGIGRTGTVVGAWLAQQGQVTGEAVLRRLAELRAGLPDADRPSPETEAQRRLVTTWPPRGG
ncbi:MAG: hypothetical protein GX442_17645 [Candidatus Riflebacteria bacterium]|nr:hypothetical protein [Candidatus Riflebacteria bacterium]